MKKMLPGLLVGIIFGAGLALSDMINPARVLAFLDPLGAWDPTLAFVMAGAVVPSAIGYLVVRRMKAPLMAEQFCIPENRIVERRLIVGAALFGIGWGLVGFCPGPAFAALAFSWQAWIFGIGMLMGMSLHWIATIRPRRMEAAANA